MLLFFSPVLLSQPVRARVAIVEPAANKYEAKLAEDLVAADALTSIDGLLSLILFVIFNEAHILVYTRMNYSRHYASEARKVL